MTIYHYHAMAQTGPATTEHFDGLLHTQKPVVTAEDYEATKRTILAFEGYKKSEIDIEKLIICNLSVIEK